MVDLIPILIGRSGEVGQHSDGAPTQEDLDWDAFVFDSAPGARTGGGFSDVSGLGAEITLAEYRSGSAHTSDWTDLNDSDPGVSPMSSDPEWRYVPVRRVAGDDRGETDLPLIDDGLF